jgi:hypothetical protein
MSLFNLIGGIFKPAADLVDELHVSDEERGQIQAKLAEIEAKVSTKMLDLQSHAITAQAEMEKSIQANGNVFTRSVRPVISLLSFLTIMGMAFGWIDMNELIVKVCGGYLGVYAGLRTYEKKK